MKNLLTIILLVIFTVACQNNNDDFNYEVILGEYKGTLSYFDSPGWDVMGNYITELSKWDEYKTTIKKVGSNYIMSFDTSFVYKIPDLTIEISPSKSPDVYGITTLFGQAYSAINKEYTYNNQPSNYFSVSKYPRVVNCDLTLRSNDPDSTYFIQMLIHRIY